MHRAFFGRRELPFGSGPDPRFPEALQLVHLYSRGIPHVINLLCENALIASYVDGVGPVAPHVIEAMGREFGLYLPLSSTPTGGFVSSDKQMPSTTSVNCDADAVASLKGQEK